MNALKLLLVALAATPLIASAQNYIKLDTVFDGDTPKTNVSASPYLTATFTGITGGVHLVLDASNLLPAEFVSTWTFNLAHQATLPADITNPFGIYPVSVTQSADKEDAGPLKGFDLSFGFSTDNNNKQPFRLNGGNTYSIDLAGVTFDDFNQPNSKGYFSAAHIQGIPMGNGKDGSAWVFNSDGGGGDPGSIPEPSTYAAFAGLAALALGVWRHRRKV